jgi:thiamine biosynthesis lipoprotein
MACEFSIMFPGGIRRGIDAGCAALDEIDRLETRLSVYRDDSDISHINRCAAGSPVLVDAEVYALLREAVRLSMATGGAFDAAAGALVKAWGFFRGPRRVPSEAELAVALQVTGSGRVIFNDCQRTVAFDRSGVEFNLGGIGKGFAIDRALDRMRTDFGIRCALLQGGQSSLRAIGAPPRQPRGWSIGIGGLLRNGSHFARVWLRDRALGTSGAANQFFMHRGRRYGHVLDPRTGRPARGLLSASAIAPTAAEADALSTAFFVLGVEATRRYCREHTDIGAVLVAAPKVAGAAPEVIVTGAADAEVIV